MKSPDVIDALGRSVVGFADGDRVVALTRFGGYADTVVVPAAQVFHVPDSLSDAEAAAVPVNYLTAALALYRMAALSCGETVAGAQCRRRRRHRRHPAGAAAPRDRHRHGVSAFKHDALRRLGVDHRDRLPARRRRRRKSGRLPRGRGRGRDPRSDRRTSFTDSYRLLAPLGRLVMFGLSAAAAGERRSRWRAFQAWRRTPSIQPDVAHQPEPGVFGLHLGHLWNEGRALAPLMSMLMHELAAGRLTPVVARTFPLERAADAHRFIQARQNIGKVVLTT